MKRTLSVLMTLLVTLMLLQTPLIGQAAVKAPAKKTVGKILTKAASGLKPDQLVAITKQGVVKITTSSGKVKTGFVVKFGDNNSVLTSYSEAEQLNKAIAVTTWDGKKFTTDQGIVEFDLIIYHMPDEFQPLSKPLELAQQNASAAKKEIVNVVTSQQVTKNPVKSGQVLSNPDKKLISLAFSCPPEFSGAPVLNGSGKLVGMVISSTATRTTGKSVIRVKEYTTQFMAP
ncbi:MAG: S1 family peptidase [Acidobacteriota bacterium]